MKTSNKLLFCAGAGLAMAFISFLISLRSNLEKHERVVVIGNGVENIEIRIDQIISDVYVLNDNFDYELDPNSTSATIKGEENVIPLVDIFETDNSLRVKWNQNNVNLENHKPIVITLGTANKKILTLNLGDNARITTKDTLFLDMLDLEIDDNAKAKFDLVAQNSTFDINDNGELDISGSTTSINVNINDNAKVRGYKMTVGNGIMNMNGNAEIFVKDINFASGKIKGNAQIHTAGDLENIKVKKYENASVKSI